MSRRTVFLMLCALLVMAPRPAVAQRGGPPPGRQEMERRIRARFEQRLFRDLGLTRDEAVRVREVMATFGRQRRELADREREARQKVQGILEGRARGDAIDADDARSALRAIIELRAEEARLFGQEQEALLEVLRPEQVLRLIQARENFAEQVRRLRRRGGGPGGGLGTR